ncbi:hypothetical protein MJO28_004143 [Puccinia striiformis f. sp. tritici]|uniref:Uncharacterized protein n=1 Tax=Puccinia striiformis f. sp. tritici TaxID=168172 RepID=A0ACC0EMZ1_9BASI|nr:hypothetical protein MJO28_004143 [Puccinia striiformis f. sp. tritici]
MKSQTGGTINAFGALARSRSRALVPLALAAGIVLYFYLHFYRPILFDAPRLPVEEVKKAQIVDHDEPGGEALHDTSAEIPENITLTETNALDPNKTYTQEELMRLPILHHTFEDAFDPRNGFKPLPDSKSPWLANTTIGAKLINRLSRNRFPPPGSIDSSRGSLPPPIPIWPQKSWLIEKRDPLKTPIPKDRIAGLNTSYVWTNRHRIPEGKLPKVQWSGFDKPDWESTSDRVNRLERQAWVRRGFQHVWEGYKAKAWGHDELKPISGSFEDGFAGWGATLIDSLDTLLIMNLTREYNYARTHVKAVDWAWAVEMQNNWGQSAGGGHPEISLFETVIRYLGGLISAYDLSGDELMLQRAEDLAEWLLPAFGTSSGFPMTQYRLGSNPRGKSSGRVVTADVGSLTLEFTRLSQLTSKDYYYDVVQKITDLLDGDQWNSPRRLGALFPEMINPDHPQFLGSKYSLGANIDSYYEYLIKQHQLLRGTKSQYSKMYTSVIESARTHLMKTYDIESPGGKNVTVLGTIEWGLFTPALDHLICFAGGMIGLGAQLLNRTQDLDLALKHTDACAWAYESTKTGVGPDEASVVEADDQFTPWQVVYHEGKAYREVDPKQAPGPLVTNPRYIGRPETIESVYYMWRITGDRQWQDRGWRMFTSWMESCVTNFGFANLDNVNRLPPQHSDSQQSFVLAETFKYYYLLFSEPDLISLDDYVLNTEAHPFRIDSPGKSIKRYWTKSDESIDKIYDPPGVGEKEHGYGTLLQQWDRVNVHEISQANLLIYNRILGVK